MFRRAWQFAGRLDALSAPRRLHDLRASRRRTDRRRSRRRPALRGFFNVCRHHAAAVVTGHTWLRAAVQVSVSRLDLRARWCAEGNAGLRRCVRLRPLGSRPCPGRLRRGGAVGVREARAERRDARAPFWVPSLYPPSWRAWSRRAALAGEATLHARLQLEGVRRQLPRWRISRPSRAPRARQRSQFP